MYIYLLLMYLLSKKYAPNQRHLKNSLQMKAKSIRHLLHIGIPSSMQYAMESGAFAVSGIMIGWFGATQLAAHQIAISIAGLTFMVSMGLSSAGSILVGNSLGRRVQEGARAYGIRTLLIGLIYGIMCALTYILTNQRSEEH